MTHDPAFNKGFQLLGIFFLFLMLSFVVLSQTRVQAANLSAMSDTLTSSKISTASNHTITFRAASSVSSGTMVVNLTNVVASIGSVDVTDVDLTYGGVDQTLAATAASNTWGVSVGGGGLTTFTYPTSCSSPCAPISAGAIVTILIGTNANSGNAQMTNVATAGSKYVSIVAGSNIGLFAVSILSNSSISVSGTANIPSGTSSTTSSSSSSSSTSTTPTPTTTTQEPQTTAEATPTAPVSQTAPQDTLPETTTPTTTTQEPQTTAEATPTAPITQPAAEETTPPAPVVQPAADETTTLTTQAPALPEISTPIAQAESIVVPITTGSTGSLTPYVVGVTNSVGGGGAQALIPSGTFLTESGDQTPVIVSVTPMPFDASLDWTGCTNLKSTKVLGRIVYSLQAQNSAPKNPGDVAVFGQRPIQFTIKYSQEDIERQGFVESSIRPFGFDPEDCDQKVAFVLDTEKNTVTITVVPKTFFALTGSIIPGFVETETVAYPTFEITPVVSDISGQDFNLTDTDGNTELGMNGNQFAAIGSSVIDLCISSKLFKKPVKKIILSLAGTQYPLRYNEARDCFGARIKIPEQNGEQDVELKIIYIDDQVQIIKLRTIITSEFQSNLLQFALPFLNQIQALNEQVEKTVTENQSLIQTGAAVAVPIVGVANPSLVTNALNWYYYINHFFSWLLSLLGIRKKRRSWGVVYNSITKNTIDLVIVRLFEKTSNRLIETQVTDKSGRFSFLAPMGEYYITATKNPLVFPTTIVKGSIDGDYTHIYRKESFSLTTPDQIMTLSIPLDPPAFDHAVVAQKIHLIKWWKTFVGKNPVAPLLVGFVVSEILVLYIPNPVNYTLLAFNGFFLVTQIVLGLRAEKSWGLVFDAQTLAPVPLAAITLFDAQEGKMLRTRLTDYFGRFSFLTPTGKYLLAVTKEGYQFPVSKDTHIAKYHHLYFGEAFSVKGKKAFIKTNIPITPQSVASIPIATQEASPMDRSADHVPSLHEPDATIVPEQPPSQTIEVTEDHELATPLILSEQPSEPAPEQSQDQSQDQSPRTP